MSLIEGLNRQFRKVTKTISISTFRMPILKSCRTRKECQQKIIETVKHEIAHHFGSGERGARKASRN
ncbi:metallopeptidase family protein [Candidatus Parcubacteria bacterium]|nr:metallopeptidase family protein [Candidatus Parcubacteria bacterium]